MVMAFGGITPQATGTTTPAPLGGIGPQPSMGSPAGGDSIVNVTRPAPVDPRPSPFSPAQLSNWSGRTTPASGFANLTTPAPSFASPIFKQQTAPTNPQPRLRRIYR